jgi:hypothetical protein
MNHLIARIAFRSNRGALIRGLVCLLTLLLGHWAGTLQAQPFNSGSTGAYGALNVTNDLTLDMPPDGIFHCTTITVASAASLRFNRNPLNTPVYLLATGDINIAGFIDVSGANGSNHSPGAGGPGGFDGGYGGYGIGATSHGGDGQGPGAGKNQFVMQHAVFAAPVNNNSNVYGNALLSPLIGGSGGCGSDGNPGGYGGGGGGAILLASNTQITLTGRIYSNGGGGSGAGSGGGVRLVAPIVGGSGLIQTYSPYSGPSGRVRIDCQDRLAFRSLALVGATVTRGAQMFVFPAVQSRLDIIQAAGQSVPEGTPNPVQVQLPIGAPTNQTVVVQGRNFTGLVPIAVVVTPETGPSTTYSGQLDMSTGNPAQATFNVVIPSGNVSQIAAWTR